MIPQTLWILIGLQIGLGAFDTIFHHELTERLAWRPSQRNELKLHGIRNFFYAVLFLCLGWTMPQGALAWGVGVVLVLELVLTLWDFVEEDRTRLLPASERVTHTVLALNYGAILALLWPVLSSWAGQPTVLQLLDHGFWSWGMTMASMGVFVFGVRDLMASMRLERLAMLAPDAVLLGARAPRSILITGGTGFIGQRLVAALQARGDDVTVLTRDTRNASVLGAPLRLVTNLNQIPSDARIDGIINLAGEPIAGGLWTNKRKRLLVSSRVQATNAVISLIKRLERKPACLINGSAIGIYGARFDEAVDEQTLIIPDGSFSQKLCQAWETRARLAEGFGVRTILLRTGIVLDTSGGSLAQMLVPFEFGLGGPFGDGGQWMSWITRDDLVRLIGLCLDDDKISGPVNGTAPNPVTNLDFVRALGRELARPAVLRMPAFILRAGLGGLGEEIFLGSQNVLPDAALRAGFAFRVPTISGAFDPVLLGARRTSPSVTSPRKRSTSLVDSDHNPVFGPLRAVAHRWSRRGR
jgi:uncharacterized protein